MNPVAFVGLATFTFLLLFSGEMLLGEPSLGWRRLALLAPFPIAAALLVVAYLIRDELKPAMLVLFGAVVPALAPLLIFTVLRCIRWVREGFATGSETMPSKDAGSAPPASRSG